MESVTLTAALLMPMLLLQRPSKNANRKILISHLDRRLTLWKDGLFFDLLHEGESIQARIPNSHSHASGTDSDLHRLFSQHMMNGNVNSALRLLVDQPSNPNSPSTSTVCEIFINKHPPPGPIFPDSILLKETPSPSHDPHPVIFDAIDGQQIHRMSFRVHGAGGPSRVNAFAGGISVHPSNLLLIFATHWFSLLAVYVLPILILLD